MSGRSVTPGVMQQAAVRVATLTALLLLGFVLAYWTWEWAAPKPELSSFATTDVPPPSPDADRVFGAAAGGGAAAAQASTGTIKLLGVAAASGQRPGHAVLQADGKRVLAVREGEEISPGLSLAEVRADHVVLERGGVREKLVLPKK